MNLEDNEINFNKICRVCLKNCKKLYYLFETEAPSVLQYCGFLEVIEGDELPDKICETCNDMLLQSYKLKQLCLSSKSYLESLINNEEIFDTLNKNGYDTANSNLDFERLQSHAEDTSESELPDQQPYTCLKCKNDFPSEILFREHHCNISINGSQLILSDNECEIQKPLLRSENELSTMCKSEAENKKQTTYHCPHCEISFHCEQDVFVHQSIHSNEGPNCNICKKSFRTMKILKRHIKTHMIAKSHTCKICDKGFPESTALLRHTRTHHLRLPRDKKYTCDECGQRFTDQYYLNLHKRKHTGEKPYKCDNCPKSFYDPRSYKVHMDVHNGTKPYLCSHCGKSFVQSAHLRQHLLVHTKEKPHMCEVCNKSFTQSTSLVRHLKVHPEMAHCDMGPKSFLVSQNKKQLLKHKDSHDSQDKTTEIKYTDGENPEK